MKVHDLWNQFNQAMKNYEEITEDRKRSFDDLKEKDEKSAKEIEIQMRKIQNLVDNISIQKSKIQQNVKESQDLNDSIKKVDFLLCLLQVLNVLNRNNLLFCRVVMS